GRIAPEEAERCLPSLRRNPILRQAMVETNQKQGSPLSDRQIEEGLNNLTGEFVASIWPDIVKRTELSLERGRQIKDKEARVICFSDPEWVERLKKQGEILLWSHYANKNAGIRIGFEFPDGITGLFEITPITYQENRPEVVFSPSLEADEQTLEAIKKASTVKSKAWEYEGEF